MTAPHNLDLIYQPHKYQQEAHRQIASARYTVIVAHRRFGKTVLTVNALILAALFTPGGIFAYIAPYLKQAKAVAWAYLAEYTANIPGVSVSQSELSVTFPNGATIRLFGADNADSLRGLGFDGVVADEVADMKADAWGSVIRPALADKGGFAIFIGTPRGIDAFYELYDKARSRDGWASAIFRADETDIIDKQELEEARQSMSDSQFRREFLCDFSASVEDVLIPIDLITAATSRKALDQHGQPKVLGVDPARYGGDRSVIFPRHGRKALEPVVRTDIDNMQLAGLVAKMIDRWLPDAVFIDAGRGEGVIDRLLQLGYDPVEVNFGGRASRPGFANKRAEMWSNMRDWISDSGSLPNIPDLKTDLSSPTYTFDAGNRLALERKEAMRKRGIKSPDLADALALTFAQEVFAADFDGVVSEDRPSNLLTDHDDFYAAYS